MDETPDTAPPDALRAVFGRALTKPLPSGGTALHDELVTAIELHPNELWTLYLRGAIDRIDELENIVSGLYLEGKQPA